MLRHGLEQKLPAEKFWQLSNEILDLFLFLGKSGKGRDFDFAARFVTAMESDFWIDFNTFSLDAQNKMLEALRERQKLRDMRWVEDLRPAWQAMLGIRSNT